MEWSFHLDANRTLPTGWKLKPLGKHYAELGHNPTFLLPVDMFITLLSIKHETEHHLRMLLRQGNFYPFFMITVKHITTCSTYRSTSQRSNRTSMEQGFRTWQVMNNMNFCICRIQQQSHCMKKRLVWFIFVDSEALFSESLCLIFVSCQKQRIQQAEFLFLGEATSRKHNFKTDMVQANNQKLQQQATKIAVPWCS